MQHTYSITARQGDERLSPHPALALVQACLLRPEAVLHMQSIPVIYRRKSCRRQQGNSSFQQLRPFPPAFTPPTAACLLIWRDMRVQDTERPLQQTQLPGQRLRRQLCRQACAQLIPVSERQRWSSCELHGKMY